MEKLFFVSIALCYTIYLINSFNAAFRITESLTGEVFTKRASAKFRKILIAVFAVILMIVTIISCGIIELSISGNNVPLTFYMVLAVLMMFMQHDMNEKTAE